MTASQPALSLVGRILMAAIFLISGLGKIAAPAATAAYIQSAGVPLPDVSLWLSVIVEVGGGILLIVGYRSRLAALVLAAFTLAAALFFHRNFGDRNQMIHFMKNLAMTGGLLQTAAFGAGALSLDDRLGKAA